MQRLPTGVSRTFTFTALVLLDLSSAFDTVDHDSLLTVLRDRFAVDASALNWFKSYLSGRTQTFIVDDVRSQTAMMDCSVPTSGLCSGTIGIHFLHRRSSRGFQSSCCKLPHVYLWDWRCHQSFVNMREWHWRLVSISKAPTECVENSDRLVRQPCKS